MRSTAAVSASRSARSRLYVGFRSLPPYDELKPLVIRGIQGKLPIGARTLTR